MIFHKIKKKSVLFCKNCMIPGILYFNLKYDEINKCKENSNVPSSFFVLLFH